MRRIGELVGVRISTFSVGPDRDQTNILEVSGQVNNLKRGVDKILASQLYFGLSSKTQWLSGLYYADFISFLQPYSTVRRWDDEIEF